MRFKIILQQMAFAATAALVSLSALSFTSTAFAQSISPAQIEQFKQLPRAQQEALARQYGIDITMLERQGSGSGAAVADPQTVEQRPTEVEEISTGSRTDTELDKEAEIKPFGYNLFSGNPTTFAPVNNAPVPGNYRIGTGDTVLVQLFGQESINHSLVVDREGRITIPRLGPITVAGLSYDELKDLVQHQVSTRMIGMQVAVSMGELRSMQIFVLGEAYKPGAYTVSSLTTISQALFASGGLTDIASLRNIRLMRAGNVVTEFDLYDLLLSGNASKDRILQPGDAVFIPARGAMVKISGEVVRPAIYELKGGETLADLLSIAGGALPSAYQKALQLHRAEGDQRQLRTLDGTKTQAQQLVLQAGDELRVPRISEIIDNSVTITGAVTRGGRYEWRRGLRISDFVSSVTQDLLSDADLSYGLVIREATEDRKIRVLQFDVSSALKGDVQHDLLLETRDQLLFFSRFESEYQRALAGFGTNAGRSFGALESLRESNVAAPNSRKQLLRSVLARLQSQETQDTSALFVTIGGEVRFPGAYPLIENGTVTDLVAAAGGLKESAYLARAEITRSVSNGDSSITEYIPFNLFDVLAGNKQIDVKARDRLNIFQIPDWKDTVDVRIGGEVQFPGTYSVRRGEKLSDLIARAGGLSEHAYANGAVFTREEIRQRERERLDALVRSLRQEMASISLTEGSRLANYEQLNMLLNDLKGSEPVGRMVLNLPEILAGNNARDIELRDEDSIYIPTISNSVSIIGEVHMPSTYRYDGSYSVREYIERSGGTKRRADTARMFVVRSNGEVVPYSPRRGWFTSNARVELEPGDTIVVPLDSSYKDTTQIWATSTQIIYQLAVAAAAISRI